MQKILIFLFWVVKYLNNNNNNNIRDIMRSVTEHWAELVSITFFYNDINVLIFIKVNLLINYGMGSN